jgi:hypothetical protein
VAVVVVVVVVVIAPRATWPCTTVRREKRFDCHVGSRSARAVVHDHVNVDVDDVIVVVVVAVAVIVSMIAPRVTRHVAVNDGETREEV